jgi:hypothetical protein
MKQFFLALIISLHAFIATDAMAWSPMDAYRSTSDAFSHCQWATAGSEENQEEDDNNETEEEEEPDCD